MASRGEVSFHQGDVSAEDRLAVVRKAVRKATEEAVKQVALTAGGSSDTSKAPLSFKDPNASFNLGMELFGQDVQIVQRNIREKLDQVERDLTNVKQLIKRQEGSTDDDRENVNSNQGDDTAGKSKEVLQEEANLLSKKISFLRQCSLARSFLDESITLSKPALSTEPDWVEASKRLAQAENALDDAKILLTAKSSKQQTDSPEAQDSPALLAGFKIIDAIHSSIRRERVDLLDRAKAMFHVCVTYSEHGISVRGGKNISESANSLSDGTTTSKQGLKGVYHVLEALSPGKTNSALKDTLRRFTTELYRQVLKPVLETTANHGMTGPSDSSLSGENMEPAKSEVGSIEWACRETVDENDTTLRTGRIKVKGPVLRLEWSKEVGKAKRHGNKAIEKEDIVLENWKQALKFFQRTMQFVFEHILLEDPDLCQQVGNQLFGKPNALPSNLNLEALGLESCMIGDNDSGLVMVNLVEALAKTCIPANLKPIEMPKLHSMAEELRSFTYPFVQTMVDMHFVPVSTENDDSYHGTRLEAFSSNFEQKYIDNRRCQVLNEARSLLLKNDYHKTVETGVDVYAKREKGEIVKELDNGMDIFELHQSSISDTAAKLMALCRRTMDEAVEHTAARSGADKDTSLALLVPALYRAARESLDLYRAIIPATLGHEISTVPRTAAVFHNDCVFFQYHCLWLGLEYKAKLPPVPKESNDARGTLFHQACIFVDMVPFFRDLADRSMREMLDCQTHQMVDIVGKRITLLGQALRSDEILAEWSEAETALAAGLYHLRHLADTWRVILSHDVFVRSIGHLADALFTLYLDQVTHAKDISESACHFVGALFQKATNTTSELLDGDKSGSVTWSRFEAIGRFMDMTLMDIQAALADGLFTKVSGVELSRLITATFAQGPKRERILQALASHQ